jgi:SPP1 family predicted phage head-tail adaptor
MRDVSCKLISLSLTTDTIGVQKETVTEIECPIIKVEDIYANEFYKANEQGFKPTLRLRISALNYNNERELKYMNIVYTIIRVQEVTPDEIVLVCERKVKNV